MPLKTKFKLFGVILFWLPLFALDWWDIAVRPQEIRFDDIRAQGNRGRMAGIILNRPHAPNYRIVCNARLEASSAAYAQLCSEHFQHRQARFRARNVAFLRTHGTSGILLHGEFVSADGRTRITVPPLPDHVRAAWLAQQRTAAWWFRAFFYLLWLGMSVQFFTPFGTRDIFRLWRRKA